MTAALRTFAMLLVASLLVGCMTPPRVAQQGPGQRLDPYEKWNRKVFEFNDSVDEALLKPVSTTYRDIVPVMVRTGVGNFFGNAYDVWSAINHFLQGKLQTGTEMTVRVMTNTTFGLLGILDPASEMGLERHSEDFGQTLGRWGFGSGPYLVLPLIGPSTVRDAIGLPVDVIASPATVVQDGSARLGLSALRLVNTRANLLGATKLLDDIALDRYTFVRDAYLARRRSLLSPDEDEPVDDGDDPEPARAK